MDLLSLRTQVLEHLESFPFLLPEGWLVLAMLGVLALTALPYAHQRYWLRPLAATGVLLAAYSKYQLVAQLSLQASLPLFHNLLVLDVHAVYFCWLLLALTLLQLLAAPLPSTQYIPYIALLLATLLGGSLLVMATHWLTLYLSLALLSLASAPLLSLSSPQAATGALRYILYSMVVSATMLWGMSYYYGITGSLSLTATSLVAVPPPLVAAVVLLCCSHLLWLLGAVPLQGWLPQVYGRMAPATGAYLTVVPLLAAVAALVRLSQVFLPTLGPVLQHGMGGLALFTMLVGHAAALRQQDLRRLLAYGGMAQAGLLLAGIAALPHAQAGVVYYSTVYAAMSWAAWMGLHQLHLLGGGTTLRHAAGLGLHRPVLGASLSVVLGALVGLPPTVGFTAKWLLWNGLWTQMQQTGSFLWATVLGVSMLGTIFSAYYYLQLAYALWRPVPTAPKVLEDVQPTALVALVASLLVAGLIVGLP